MKTKLFFYSLLGLFLLLPSLSFADTETPNEGDEIKTGGKWNDSGERSLYPSQPVAYLSVNNIYVYFPKAISDVVIRIVDLSGNLIYEDVIFQGRNSYYFIPCNLDEGEYVLTISHLRGSLVGSFRI